MQASILAAVDPQLDLSPQTPDGQFLGIYASDMGGVWEVLQACDNEINRQDAEGAALDNIGDLTGTPREGESYTQVYCTCALNSADAPYAIGALTANIAGQTSQTFTNVYQVTAADISGGIATVLFQATTPGQTPAVNPNTLTAITNPVTGWTSVTNPAGQSQLGTNAELDPQYMVRQVVELAGGGGDTAQSLAAALVQLGAAQAPPVALSVLVLENRTPQYATVQGVVLAPNSFAPIIYDATGWSASSIGQAAIGAVLYANQPPGICLQGSIAVTVQDPILGSQTVAYTIPTVVVVDVVTTIAPQPNVTFSTLQAAVQAALPQAAVAPTPATGIPPLGQLTPGVWVIQTQLEGVIASVPGVFDIQSLQWCVHGGTPGTSALVINANQVATFVGGTITVNQGTYP